MSDPLGGPGFLSPLDLLIWGTSEIPNSADSQRHARPHFMDKAISSDFPENKTNIRPCVGLPDYDKAFCLFIHKN